MCEEKEISVNFANSGTFNISLFQLSSWNIVVTKKVGDNVYGRNGETHFFISSDDYDLIQVEKRNYEIDKLLEE